MTIAKALDAATERLSAAGVTTARLDAEVLLRHVLAVDRTGLFLRLQDEIENDDYADFDALIARRLAREPVAYLIGEREFMGLRFAVGPGVLVPRPETEFLVEWATIWLATRPAATVVDVGTGSGAIAVSLAASLPAQWRGRLLAVDVSPAALRFAERNRAAHLPAGRLHLVRGSLLSWCRGPVDLVLANLPYLRPDQIEEQPDLHVEPMVALDGGAHGLELIASLLADAPRILTPDGAIGLEIDPSLAAGIERLARSAFPGASVGVKADLAGLARYVLIELATGTGR